MYIIFILLATLNITSLMILLIALVNIGVSDMKMIGEEVRLVKLSGTVFILSATIIYLLLLSLIHI